MPSLLSRSLAALCLSFVPGVALADGLPTVKLSGDVRFRLEDDWDSHTPTDTLRPERQRVRVRARLGATVDLGGGFTLQGRLRTGVPDSQQNANVTFADFTGNPVDRLKIGAEHYSLAWQDKTAGVEVGRMAFPFFTTNEYFWDADIAPLGGAGHVVVPLGGGAKLKLTGGAFALPVGLAHYSGSLVAGQAVVEDRALTLAGGLFRLSADRSNPERLVLLDDNGSRDYTVLALNGQYRLRAAGKPVTLTADLYRNLQGYGADPDPISRTYDGERTGFVLGAALGDIAAKGHWQLGYRYFHMEKLAVDSSYSHDDVARLGTANQADLTDLAGHDMYVNYQMTRHWTIGARVMLSRRITDIEDDKRARVDLSFAL